LPKREIKDLKEIGGFQLPKVEKGENHHIHMFGFHCVANHIKG
jgi:hypothetical protein